MSTGRVNVRELGAKGDGLAVETGIFQKAIDLCARDGGGVVYVPPGRYVSGMLRLYSYITLYLAGGAVLEASRDEKDYIKFPPPGFGDNRTGVFLTAEDEDCLSIDGPGVVDGGHPEEMLRGAEKPDFRLRLLYFNRCRRIQFTRTKFQNSDLWTLHLKRCEDVVIDGITIFNNIFRGNSDGINPDSCKNVRISNCDIVSGDDSIVLKSTEEHPCENVVVNNCTLASGTTALKVGTESKGDFRDLHFSNCVVSRGMSGLGIFIKDGAVCERVAFSGISIRDWEEGAYVRRASPIVIDIERRHKGSAVGIIRDILLENIFIESVYPSIIQGMPERPLENLTLRNITQRVNRWIDWSGRVKPVTGRRTTSDERDTLYTRDPAYLVVALTDGLRADNISLYLEKKARGSKLRAALSLHRIKGESIGNVKRIPEGGCGDYPAVLKEWQIGEDRAITKS